MSSEPGLRERKKQQRRACIEAAAIDLFETGGFDGTTIDDIAAAADIAPRTFFYYFPTKEDVVLADYASRLERITDELGRRAVTEPPWMALRASFLAVADDYEVHRQQLIRRFAIMAANPSVYARNLQLQAGWEDTVTEILTRGMSSRDGDIGPRLLASAALACMRSSVHHWIQTGHRQPLPDLVRGCFDQFAAGMANLG